MSEPYVFISHKHVDPDRKIAEELARFVRRSTAGKVRVHLSSSTEFEGPRLGKNLNAELKRALAQTDIVLLVYTTATADWSYCMWECGVATDPTDANPTSVIVVQCGTEEPKPYSDELRVNAADHDSIEVLVKALLTSTDLFAHLEEPVTGFSAEGQDIKQFASDLEAALEPLLAESGGADRITPTAPYLRIQVGPGGVSALRATGKGETDLAELGQSLRTQARVTDHDRVSELFGMRIAPDTTLGDIVDDWSDSAEGAARWFESLADQFRAAVAGQFRAVPWAPYSSESGKADVPVVAGSRETVGGSYEFDIYFIPIAPRPVAVRERMLPIAQTYHKTLADVSLESIALLDLTKEISELRHTRVPVLDESGAPFLIVHKATINQFLVDHMSEAGGASSLTMKDMVEAADLGKALRTGSFAVVGPGASMEEAIEAMEGIPRCQDVFVTEDGEVDGKVVGWLTNVMFIDAAPTTATD